MKGLKLIVILFFVLGKLYSQNEIFNNWHRTYKVKSQIHFGLNKFSHCTESDLCINFEKKSFDSFHEIEFGYEDIESEYIKYRNDTIFYLMRKNNNFLDQSMEESPLFVFKSNNNDSIFISKFGVLENHYIKLNNCGYSSTLNDTVYVYKLSYHEKEEKRDVVHESSKNHYFFKKIIISKKFGFVEVSFKRYNTLSELRFY